MTAAPTVSGSCACTSITFRATRPEGKSCINCHCGLCRRLSGAAFTTWVSVASAEFDVLSGESSLAEYQATENVRRFFCTHCGTHVFSRDKRYPNIHGAPLGVVAEPHGFAPAGDYFSSDKAAWAHLSPGIPHFGGASGFGPLAARDQGSGC